MTKEQAELAAILLGAQIDGIGVKTIQTIINIDKINNIKDLRNLQEEELSKIIGNSKFKLLDDWFSENKSSKDLEKYKEAFYSLSIAPLNFCPNVECFGRNIALLKHAVGRGKFEIDELGSETLELLQEKGLIKSISDIFMLKEQDLFALPNFQKKSSDNLIRSIDNARNPTLDKFLFALGIPGFGASICKDIAKFI